MGRHIFTPKIGTFIVNPVICLGGSKPMTKRLEVNDGEWMDVSDKLVNSVQAHAIDNNLRYGEAFVDYVESGLVGEETEEETEE
jgi:hypothetical protein